MTYEMNKQLATTLNSLQPQLMNLPEFIPGDVLSWRKRGNALYELFQETMPPIGDMAHEDLWVPYGENSLKARWYCGSEVSSRGVVLFIHGGGGVAGSVDFYDPIVASYVRSSGVSFLSIEYGLAPEIDGYTQTKQAFSTLKWLRENSERFGIDPERIVLMGDSGGGGIAASAALMARDNLVPFAGLVLIYPMLDDRVDETEKAITPYLSISAAEIVTLWHARMPQGTDDALRAYISPARAGNLAGLPPVFIDVGELDLFCREAHEWSLKLVTDEVPVEFHSYPGVNHGFDLLAPESDIATQAMQLRSAAIRRMVVSAINS